MTQPSPKDALDALIKLWHMERAATRARFIAERQQTNLEERVEQGNALKGLSIDDVDAAPGGRMLLWLTTDNPEGMSELRVGPGAPVRLWWDEPTNPEAVLGTVARRQRQRLGVMIDDVPPVELEAGNFNLDKDDPDATFNRGLKALRTFKEAPQDSDIGRLRQTLFGARKPEFGPEPAIKIQDKALNDAQCTAVALATAAKDLALVHGPPGTGKTRTLVEIVRQAVERGERVMVSAASNAAVDNLAERLVAAGVQVIRLGHPARVSSEMEPNSLDALLERTSAFKMARRWISDAAEIRRKVAKKWQRRSISYQERRDLYQEARRMTSDARRHLRAAQESLIAAAQVVCATAAGADSTLLGKEVFDLVVLDEATQAADPIALVAMARAKRVVMAGDPHQLPPTVIDPKAAKAGLSQTFFERLYQQWPQAGHMLVVQHRMHTNIMAFPSESKYDGRLVAAEEVADHRLEALPGVSPDPMRADPLIFIDTSGRGWDEVRTAENPSTHNPDQAQRVVEEVQRILDRGLFPSDLAVITPYLAQARLLRQLLAEPVRLGLEIDTVDGFQGREKEAIVLDLVRSNERGELGFLTDTRRMNVALTRARRALVVIGDSATLGNHRYYNDFMEAVEIYGAWLSAWS